MKKYTVHKVDTLNFIAFKSGIKEDFTFTNLKETSPKNIIGTLVIRII